MRRKIILNLATSLDAFIEGAKGEIDWCFTDQDYGMTTFLERVDTIFFGRKSYEQLLTLAPDAFADKEKIVFSSTLKADKNIRIIRDNLASEVQQILQSKGKDIWLFGGAELITTMLKAGLVDELMIAIHPMILGAGKPLLNGITNRVPLKLINTETFSTGLVQVFYEVLKKS